jgi:hypothetical protein
MFSPNSPFKIKWDLLIIILSLYNSILVPLQFSFSDIFDDKFYLSYIDYIIDVFFFMDIVVNFRTIYIDTKTDLPVTDGKKIAFNYLFKGRFLIDFVASLPTEEIYQLFNKKDSG